MKPAQGESEKNRSRPKIFWPNSGQFVALTYSESRQGWLLVRGSTGLKGPRRERAVGQGRGSREPRVECWSVESPELSLSAAITYDESALTSDRLHLTSGFLVHSSNTHDGWEQGKQHGFSDCGLAVPLSFRCRFAVGSRA